MAPASNAWDGKYGTLHHLSAIAEFLKPFEPLWQAHVVDFFQDKLWDLVDPDWMMTLQSMEMEEMLLLPSGFVQVSWPPSLQNFVSEAHSLAVQREARVSAEMDMSVNGECPTRDGADRWLELICYLLPSNVLKNSCGDQTQVAHIGSVLAQGMNSKKRHEIGVLAALISSVAEGVKATDIIDVGAGQGYLAQVLAFEYGLPVVALDASKHHADVTNERAERIKKHYKSRVHKSFFTGNNNVGVVGPETFTCRVASGSSAPTSLSSMLPLLDFERLSNTSGVGDSQVSQTEKTRSVVLAGLHACGDLSANMIRAFLDCKDVKAVVCVGCCYNLLGSEGFPLSKGARGLDLQLDRNGRDLACQSAARWRESGTEAARQNFEVHAFRAAFQLILHRFYPEVAKTSPSVGRLGKARRRRQARRQSEASSNCCVSPVSTLAEAAGPSGRWQWNKQGVARSTSRGRVFAEYTNEALKRMNLVPAPDLDVESIWHEVELHLDLVGPFWTLRTVLAPVLETFILLDRLLCLEESTAALDSRLLPLFDPAISPRNMAIIATRD